jgi:hypothetical protein
MLTEEQCAWVRGFTGIDPGPPVDTSDDIPRPVRCRDQTRRAGEAGARAVGAV